jgi:hypothetical protein
MCLADRSVAGRVVAAVLGLSVTIAALVAPAHVPAQTMSRGEP